MNRFIRVLLLFFFYENILCAKIIHIFGDSHSYYCFVNSNNNVPFRSAANREESFMYNFDCAGKVITVPFRIHWLFSLSMEQFATEKKKILDIRKFGVSNGDIIVFVFGEIDVRQRIGKAIGNKSLTEVIDTLTMQYFDAIRQNVQNYEELTIVIMGIIPPVDKLYLEKYENISNRIQFTRNLNLRLKNLCQLHNYYFLDIYDLYAQSDGALDKRYSDETVHINPLYNKPIKEHLLKLIASSKDLA